MSACMARNKRTLCSAASGPSRIVMVASMPSQAKGSEPEASNTNSAARGSRRRWPVRTRLGSPELHSFPSTKATPTRTTWGPPSARSVTMAAAWFRSRNSRSPSSSAGVTGPARSPRGGPGRR